MTKSELEQILDGALGPVRRLMERESGSGEQVRLRETQRQQRFSETARRQDMRDAKALCKAERKLFESLGFSKEAAKRAARAGVPPVPGPLRGTVTFSEAETKVREAQRELRGVERRVQKAERKDAARVFESLGMPEAAAKLAAVGRR